MTILPIFPLPNVVLFPGGQIPLHIFEERYREMISDILEGDKRFGLALCKDYDPVTLVGEPFDVGCVAKITEHETLEDGRMNILAEGVERYYATDYIEDGKPYLRAEVAWIEDQSERKISSKLLEETTSLFQEALRLSYKILGRPQSVKTIPDDPGALSFFIAENLKGSLILKQELLEMTSVKARLENERDVLGRMVKTLAVRTQIEDAFREE